MSAITYAELQFGVAASRKATQAANRAALKSLLQDIPVAAFDSAAATAYGPIRAASRELTRDALDKLIAAHAVALGVTLVTNNEADFAHDPGLVVENWVS